MEDRSEVTSSLGAAGEVPLVGNGSDHESNMAAGDIEGGNAPPPEENAYRYKKTKGHTTTKGQMFEIKFIALLFLRLVNSEFISEFHLASNVEGAGALDDVVVKYKTKDNPHEWKSCFLQLKHKETGSLGINHFKAEPTKKEKQGGDFSLKKYLKSYIEISKRIAASDGLIFKELQVKDSVFVIYTNAKLHKDLLECKGTYCESEIDTFLKSERPRRDRLPANQETESYGSIFNITEECNKGLFEYLVADETTRSDAHEFLKALKVYSGQPSEKEFDEIIKPELLKATGLNKPDVDLLYRSFLETVETWWSCSNSRTLTRNSNMLKKTRESFKLKKLSSKSIEQYHLNISFLENCHFPSDCRDADQKIKPDSLVHIVSPALCAKLSCTKLLQSLPNDCKYMFLSLDDLLKNTDAVMSAWSSWQYSCLVVVSESDRSQEKLCNNLCARLQDENVEKKEAQKAHKIIIVSAQDDAFSANLKKGFKGRVTEVQDSFQLTQLERDSKDQINNGSVLFQEQKVILGDLLDGGADLQTGVLNDKLVHNILNRTDIEIGPKLEPTVSYYIPRTIVRYDVLSKDVLKEKDDAFIVHGITETNLQKLVPSQETVGLVGVEGDINKCRFFVMGSGSTKDTSEVYRRKHNVHELKMSPEGTLRWVQSKGSLDCINKHIDVKQSGSSCPETVMDFDSRVTLLEASPGMGKSTFVTHLAEETKRMHPLTWVIRIDLSQHMKLFKTMSCEDGTQFLESALSIDKRTTTERALFRHSMETKGNVVGILDGCDEVAPEYTQKCLTLISSLQKTKLSKIIVTTRHSLRSEIEKRVSTLAFNLHPFTKENQEMFFRKYCKHQSGTLEVQGVVQKQVVTKFLNQMEESLNNEEKEFLGIPLHAMMLAEIYQDKVHNPDLQIPEKLKLLYIFQTVIDKKFCIYFKKKFAGADNVEFLKKIIINEINHDHMYAALVLLLSKTQFETFDLNTQSEIIKGNNKLTVAVEDGENNTGIVDKFLDDKAIFIHRTYAEYFAALWFSENYKKCHGFLQIFIYTEEFKVVRRFFDLLLASNSEFLTSVINNDGPTIRTLMKGNVNAVDIGGRSALHLAASFGFDCEKIKPIPKHTQEHLVDCLIKEGADVNVKDKVFELTAMEYAMNLKSWDVIDVLINHYSKKKRRVWLNQLTKRNGIEVCALWSENVGISSSLVHQAAAYGHINIIKVFLTQRSRLHKSGILQRTIQSIIYLRDGHNSTPLHEACLHNQLRVAAALIASLGRNTNAVAAYMNMEDEDGESALDYAIKHGGLELIQYLASNRTDIWALDEDSRTPLFVACQENNVAAAKALIASLGSDSAAITRYINMQDKHGRSILHYACCYGGPELIEHLVSNGANIWALDEDSRNPLFVACQENNVAGAKALIASLGPDSAAITRYINMQDKDGDSVLHRACLLGGLELTEYLVSNGANIWALDEERRTPLFAICLEINVAGAKALIASLGPDSAAITRYINMQDKDGASVLHVACLLGGPELIEYLVSNGANIWALDEDSRTPLFHTCDKNNVAAAKALIASLGPDSAAITRYINMQDKDGASVLHRACLLGGPELIEYLVSNGANIWALDEDSRTPLFYTCDKNNVAAAKALIASLGPDSAAITRYINMEDKHGASVLHRACLLGGPELIEYLVSNGADIWALDEHNRTPLFATCEKNNVAAAKALIASLGPDSAAITRYINMQDKHGASVLHRACLLGGPELIEYLVSNGANIWALDEHNRTPLFDTWEKNNVAAAKALIASLGSDSAAITRYINMEDKYGASVLHRACELGDPELIEYLVSNGANIWALDEHNRTPLFDTWEKNNVAAAKALIASLGPDSAAITRYINMEDKYGASVLHRACELGDPELIEYLVSNGANIWALDEHNRTPLFDTWEKNNVAAAKALIASLGPDSAAITRYINMEDKYGASALHRACEHGGPELIEYLVSTHIAHNIH